MFSATIVGARQCFCDPYDPRAKKHLDKGSVGTRRDWLGAWKCHGRRSGQRGGYSGGVLSRHMTFPKIGYGMTIGIFIMVNDEDLSMKVRGVMTGIATERMIDDITMLKALADPIRMTLLDLTMGQPERTWTARELAAQVGVLPTNIYYHLNMLERQELLIVRDTRVVNGIIEKHYGAGQRSLTFHRKPGGSPDGNRALNVTMLNRARDEMDAGLAAGTMSTGREAPDSRRMMVSMSVVKIPENEIAAFREELLRMVQRYETADADGHQFTVMAAIYPS